MSDPNFTAGDYLCRFYIRPHDGCLVDGAHGRAYQPEFGVKYALAMLAKLGVNVAVVDANRVPVKAVLSEDVVRMAKLFDTGKLTPKNAEGWASVVEVYERDLYSNPSLEALLEISALVRELDVLINGEEGAAAQASLCDLVAQVKSKGFVLKRPEAVQQVIKTLEELGATAYSNIDRDKARAALKEWEQTK